jgi:hypothetical protein
MKPTSTVVEAARACPLLTRAHAVAAFVGAGRLVTAKAVLRRADIPAVCAATGLPDSGRVVSAAHVPALHRAWTAAQGSGILAVGHREACAVATTADAIDQWRHGVSAVLRAESDDPGRRGAAIVCTAALDVLTSSPGLPDPHFGDALDVVFDRLPLRDQMAVPSTFRRGLLPEWGAAELLAECGAIDPATRTVTPLGFWARPEFDRPPAPRVSWADDDALELRIDLDRFRPPVWRRVRLRAATTLTELHEIIQVLFEWDGDHLHVFTVDGVRYADPLNGLEDCPDSDQLSLAAALPRPGARLTYRYDLGDCWDHTVLLESGGSTGAPDRPTCTGGRGDVPVEDWPDDEPPPPRPLDLAALDRRLAQQVGRP